MIGAIGPLRLWRRAMPGPIAFLLALRPRAAARRAARARDWRLAADRYGALAARGLAGPRDLVQMGHALKEAGDPAAADAYRRAVADFPLDMQARRQHGLFLRLVGDADEATDALVRAAILAPDDADLLDELAGFGLDERARDERMVVALLAGDGIPHARRNPVAWLRAALAARAARAHARAGRWPQAARACRDALAADPRRPETIAALGVALLAGGDAAGAAGAYGLALLHRPRTPAWFAALGDALAADGRRAAARRAWLAALRLQPGEPAATAALVEAGWTPAGLGHVANRSWRLVEAAAPDGLGRTERAIWAHLAHTVGED